MPPKLRTAGSKTRSVPPKTPKTRSAFTARYRALKTVLVEARQAAGLTQATLAKRLGRPQSFVSKYERGERRLDVIEFLDVAGALKIDVATALANVTKPEQP